MAFASQRYAASGPHSYREARDMWNASKRRKLQNNTYLVQTREGFGIRLHNTVIVEFKLGGRIRLNTGGWLTVTTKARMNAYLPRELGRRVSSMRVKGRSRWCIADALTWAPLALFEDGCEITPSGKVQGGDRVPVEKIKPKPVRTPEHQARLDRERARRAERRAAVTATAFHFTTGTLRDGRPIPAIGEWLTEPGELRICCNGLHASRSVAQAHCYAPGDWRYLHLVEVRDIKKEEPTKLMGRHRRILATISREDVDAIVFEHPNARNVAGCEFEIADALVQRFKASELAAVPA